MKNWKTLLLSWLMLSLCASVVGAQQKLLTIDDLFHPEKKVDFSGKVPTITWLSDGKHYLLTDDSETRNLTKLQKVNAISGAAKPFLDATKLEAAFMGLGGFNASDAKQLATKSAYQLNKDETALLINWARDLFYYDLKTGKAQRVTNNPDEEVGETFSPDSRMIGFVRNNDIYVVDLAQGRERQLTSDGTHKILNGRLDWVYQEELYGRGNFEAYWWSPDSSMLAYLRFDENPVREFTVVDHIPFYQELEVSPYPKAGEANPLVRLGVVSALGGSTRWIDTMQKYQPSDLLIVRVAWTPDSKNVVYQAQNREQTFLDLNFAEATSGKTRTLFRENSKAWVEVLDNPHWLKDGSFLWESERSGWHHLYHYNANGQLLRQLTEGKWEVRSVESIDYDRGVVYITATEHSHIAPHVYSVKLDGTGLKRLSTDEGSHNVKFDPTSNYFVAYWTDLNTPTQTRLHDISGKVVRVIEENKVETLKQYKMGPAEQLRVKTRDGFEMEALLIKPPDFNPAKKYPVMQFTYSGPHAPQVKNSWGGSNYMWHQMLAQKGYLIWICDNRTASGKGVESTWPVYKNFGELELRDLEDGIAWLKNQPFVDGTRIGIWGWSYGGFMTSYALTHSKTYKLGIAGGTVSDWLNYDTIYTERYLQTPQNNPEGYKKSSPVHRARDLHGKILLIHGAMDDNVHLTNTIQFAYELQKAGKQFELMLYPKSRHGVTDPALVRHMRAMMLEFIERNL